MAELGLKLPTISAPKGNYISYLQTGNLVYLSGHLPIPADGPMMTGRLGENMTTEEGYEASKVTGLQILATMKLNLGDLDRIAKVVKLFGVVNSTNDFTEQAKVSYNRTYLLFSYYIFAVTLFVFIVGFPGDEWMFRSLPSSIWWRKRKTCPH